MTVTLGNQLDLDRCPHCSVDRPTLAAVLAKQESLSFIGENRRIWGVYVCSRCGGLVTAANSEGWNRPASEIYPAPLAVDEALPAKAKDYLQQALNSLHVPAGAVMLAASAVDAMLKIKGYKDGNLYGRIDQAAADNMITKDMAQWAHAVRLEANSQRHADEESPLPTTADARRCLDFAMAFAQFMFVLPARIQKGLSEAT